MLQFCSEYDVDGDECIDFQEFVAMLARKITPDMYCVCYMEMIEEIFSVRCITSAQLALLTDIFPGGDINISQYGGNYRVELVVRLFSRVIDPQNFGIISKTLSEIEISKIIHRLGWLTCGFHPLSPFGFKVLDLSIREERCVYKMILLLSHLEEIELSEEYYRQAHGADKIIEEHKKEWLDERTLPDSIVVGFNFQFRDITTPRRNHLCSLVNTPMRYISVNEDDLPDINKMAKDLGIDLVFIAE